MAEILIVAAVLGLIFGLVKLRTGSYGRGMQSGGPLTDDERQGLHYVASRVARRVISVLAVALLVAVVHECAK